MAEVLAVRKVDAYNDVNSGLVATRSVSQKWGIALAKLEIGPQQDSGIGTL
jgi:hypothetical protein